MLQEKLYLSPSTPNFMHSIGDYLAEILLIKKHPKAIKVKQPWRNEEFRKDFLYFQSVSQTLIQQFPAHYIVDVVSRSPVTSFEPARILTYVKSKIPDWVNRNNTALNKWTIEIGTIRRFEKDKVTGIQTSQRQNRIRKW